MVTNISSAPWLRVLRTGRSELGSRLDCTLALICTNALARYRTMGRTWPYRPGMAPLLYAIPQVGVNSPGRTLEGESPLSEGGVQTGLMVPLASVD